MIKLNSSHAYIFVLQKGVKSKGMLENLAKSVLDENWQKNPDCYVLSGARKSISISEVKDLRKKLHLSSISAGKKLAIISNAEKLTPQASSALLKIVEEPQGKTVIFFFTNQLSLIQKTLISRCQVVRIKSPSLRRYLQKNCDLKDPDLLRLFEVREFWQREKILENLLRRGISFKRILEFLSLHLWQITLKNLGKGKKVSLNDLKRLEKINQMAKTETLLKEGINDKLLVENTLLKL